MKWEDSYLIRILLTNLSIISTKQAIKFGLTKSVQVFIYLIGYDKMKVKKTRYIPKVYYALSLLI